MMLNCTRCENTGFLNLHQVPRAELYETSREGLLEWIETNGNHDVQVCDCCGDGEGWYGEPGEHYGPDDPQGLDGPYAGNGGLCQCH